MDDDTVNPSAPDADGGEEEEKDTDPDLLEDTFDDVDAL